MPTTSLTGPLSASSIQTAVSEILNQDVTVPEGHRAQLITVLNQNQVDIALAAKVVKNDKAEWDVEVIGHHGWTGTKDNSFAILNKISW